LKLKGNLYPEELRVAWTLFDTYVEDVISTKVAKKIAVQAKKFSRLLRQQSSRQNRNPIILTDTKSSCTFTEEETNILNRGLNFAIRPKAPPLVDIIASIIESGIQYLPDNIKLDVRNGVKKIIKCETHHNNRVTENHRDHVVEIIREKNCYYTKADNNNDFVIMDKEKYDEGMQQLTDDGPYELMTSNPLTRTLESAKNMIRKMVETMNLSSYWKYKLKVSNPQIPLLYGLPTRRKIKCDRLLRM
jgi:hypothetical protein